MRFIPGTRVIGMDKLDYYAMDGLPMKSRSDFLDYVDGKLDGEETGLAFKGVGLDTSWFGEKLEDVLDKHFNGYKYSYVIKGGIGSLSIDGSWR
jgi:hypothetical protein